ncbi:MAG TPA: hypothetical protein VFT95_05755 [Micromonosporaceae bacterium]|nr:hypothetical protein [Micromonosporaceae bacterium]
MTASANTVAKALTDRLPDPTDVQVDRLLYLAQGHHLGWFGKPLFNAAITATDRGPHVDLTSDTRGAEPGEAELNTVGFVVSRYGNLPARDLLVLIRHQSPYELAEAGRQAGHGAVIDVEVMRRHFAAAETAERREAGITPEVEAAVSAMVAGAHERLKDAVHEDTPDDLERLRARVADHAR